MKAEQLCERTDGYGAGTRRRVGRSWYVCAGVLGVSGVLAVVIVALFASTIQGRDGGEGRSVAVPVYAPQMAWCGPADGAITVDEVDVASNVEPARGSHVHEGVSGPSATGWALLDFFTGGGQYMPRTHCVVTAEGGPDWPWIAALLGLSAGVIFWYLRIFVFWMRCYFAEVVEDRNSKLFDLATIFLMCAVCGYATSILMFAWPGYRLLVGFLLVLNVCSWRFCANLAPFARVFGAGRLDRQLREALLGREAQLEAMLAAKVGELRESERRFRTMVQNLPGAAFRFEIDAGSTNVFVSDGIEELTGYPASDFIGNAVRDYTSITHSEDREKVRGAVDAAILARATYTVEYRIVHRSGMLRWVLERGMVVCDDATGSPRYVDGLQFDISDRKESEDAVRRVSLMDRLTFLPNRALVLDRLGQAISRRARSADRHFGVLFLDFDRFKLVNDTLGHEAGDELLRQIAGRLRRSLRVPDTVGRTVESGASGGSTAGRLGGDEFVVVLDDLASPGDAMSVADRLLVALRKPYMISGHEVISTASIGIVTSDIAAGTAEDVLRDADIAMYEAKLAGKCRAVVFDARMRDRLTERLEIERELRSAIALGQLWVAFQPIVSLDTGGWQGVEALLRWNHPRLGAIPPAVFVPIAEEAGLIAQIGEWVLRESCARLSAWSAEFGDRCPRTMSVNVSRAQLALRELPDRVAGVISEFGLEPTRIQLEVTENQVMSGRSEHIAALRRLQEIGVRLAMDDFGTGLSSLSGLHELPIKVLKIDKSFVHNLCEGHQFMALARSIVELASNLGMTTVAEGIETADHVAVLQALGCSGGQGYYFGKPMPERDILAKLRADGASVAA